MSYRVTASGTVRQLTAMLVVIGCAVCQSPFILTPRDPLQVELGSNASLRWDYFSGNTINFTVWGKADGKDRIETVLASRRAGQAAVVEDDYKGRVKILGEATLVIIGVRNSDVGRYICQLVFHTGQRAFNVTTLEIKDTANNGNADKDNSSGPRAAYIGFLLVLILLFCFVLLYVFLVYRRKGFRSKKNNKRSNEEPNAAESAEIGVSNPGMEMYALGESATDNHNEQESELDDRGYCVVPPLFANPADTDWEFPRENLVVLKVIGNGAFAQVAKGNAQGLGGNKDNRLVAVKMLKKNAPKENEAELLAELSLMKRLAPHPNVIRLLGCITKSEPVAVIVEYVPHGDLRGFLRKSRGLQDSYFDDPETVPKSSLSPHQLFNFALDIAAGMEHLSSHKIIHRDLAARNVLVGESEICKITDFGMAKDVKKDNVFRRTTAGRVPVKWTAIESLVYGTCTTMSDVWSYGVVLYEIFTIGGSPFPKVGAKEVMKLLENGTKMAKPEHISDSLYKIMLECWQNNPRHRPSFSDLFRKLKSLTPRAKDYLNLGSYDSTLYQSLDELDV